MSEIQVGPKIHDPVALVRKMEQDKTATQSVEARIFTMETVKGLVKRVDDLEAIVAEIQQKVSRTDSKK